jgi:hypothetical protein
MRTKGKVAIVWETLYGIADTDEERDSIRLSVKDIA